MSRDNPFNPEPSIIPKTRYIRIEKLQTERIVNDLRSIKLNIQNQEYGKASELASNLGDFFAYYVIEDNKVFAKERAKDEKERRERKNER